VAATNPDGEEVHLPCVSDVVRHPEKHPEWQAPQGQGCQPGASPGVTAGGEGGHGGNARVRDGLERATTIPNPVESGAKGPLPGRLPAVVGR
jgi:hypothetical protein